MIVMERFVFWGEIQTNEEQSQTLNCTPRNVKIYDIDRQSWMARKKQVMEDHVAEVVIMENLYYRD